MTITRLDFRFIPGRSMFLLVLLAISAATAFADTPLDYTIELTVASKGYDRKSCWVQARAGAIPPAAPGNPSNIPIVVLTD